MFKADLKPHHIERRGIYSMPYLIDEIELWLKDYQVVISRDYNNVYVMFKLETELAIFKLTWN